MFSWMGRPSWRWWPRRAKERSGVISGQEAEEKKVSLKNLSKEELQRVNQIIAEELFAHAGDGARQAFYNQHLGSYWLIEFREKIGARLVSEGEESARIAARCEIVEYFSPVSGSIGCQ